MLKKLVIAATLVAPLYASEEATNEVIEGKQQTLSDAVAIMIKDLERMIECMEIVKDSSYNIDKTANAQRTVLVVLTKMKKLTDAGISIEEVTRFNEVYKRFKRALRETYESQTAEADIHEDEINTEAEPVTV